MTEKTILAMYEADMANARKAYEHPCAEFIEFRRLLDDAGIEWWDMSQHGEFPMHRTHGNGFSVIYGRGSYGAQGGLLELKFADDADVDGWLTAEQAFNRVVARICKPYQQYELEAFLGDDADDFDIDAIIDEATFIHSDGNRYWRETVDLSGVSERNLKGRGAAMIEFRPGELFVYTRDGNCEHMELGQVKRKVDDETYACWYSAGDTAARTNVRNMRKLANAGWSHVERAGEDDVCHMEIIDTGNEAAYECYEHIMHCGKCGNEFGYVLYDEDGSTWMDERPTRCPECGRFVR